MVERSLGWSWMIGRELGGVEPWVNGEIAATPAWPWTGAIKGWLQAMA